MIRTALPALALACAATALPAQQVEQYSLDGATVAVTLHPFLTEEEVTTLRIIGQSSDALELFVPQSGGFAALAVAPGEGFIRDGVPVESAVAIADLPNLDEARMAALEGCNAVRNDAAGCEIVLEISPE